MFSSNVFPLYSTKSVNVSVWHPVCWVTLRVLIVPIAKIELLQNGFVNSLTVTSFTRLFLHRSQKNKEWRLCWAGGPQSQRGSQRKESSGEENGSQQEEEARLKVDNQKLWHTLARAAASEQNKPMFRNTKYINIHLFTLQERGRCFKQKERRSRRIQESGMWKPFMDFIIGNRYVLGFVEL